MNEATTFHFALNASSELLYVNHSVGDLLGFTADDFLSGRISLRGQIHHEDADLIETLFSHDGRKTADTISLRIRRADGTICCAKGQYTKSRNGNEDVPVLALALRDAREIQEPGDQFLVDSYKPLLAHASDYIYIKNRNHVLLAASRSVAELTSKAADPATLSGNTDYDLFPEQEADRNYRLEKRVFAEGQSLSELQRVARDGVIHWIDNRKYPIKGPSGEIGGLFGIAPDITSHLEAKQKLKASEEALREAQKIGGLGSFVLDFVSKTWNVSEQLDTILGIGPEYDRRFEGIWPLIHPDERAKLAERIEGCFSGERKQFESEYRIIRQTDGAVRWVQTKGRLDFDTHGKPLALRGTVQDITQRRQSQEALRKSEESLREAQKIARVCNYTLDIRTGVWEGSEALEEILGISPDHPRTVAAWIEILHPEDRERMAGWLAKEIENHGTFFDGDYRIIRPSDLAVRWLKGMGKIEYAADGTPTYLQGTIQDITESKTVELELRQSKHLLELFVQQSPVALAMFDQQMHYIAASERWLEFHQLGASDLIGRSHYEVFPDLPEEWKLLHRRALSGEIVPADECSMSIRNESSKWIRRRIRPWLTGEGAIGGIILFAEDITETKRAQSALRESKELLEVFVQRAPVALAMFDREMRYLAVSQRWLQSYSLEGKEVLGQSHYRVFPDVPERWKEAHRRGLAGETLRSDQDLFERADGAVQWIRWEIVPWQTGDGPVGGIVIYAEDITAQKQAEERLSLAASVFTHAREGIVITDARGAILDVNDTFTRITGYTREEVLGDNPRLLKSGLQNPEFYQKMWRSLLEEGQWSGEIWNRTKGGDVYPEMLTISAVKDDRGQVLRYVALFSDITELKEKQRRLERIAHYDELTSLPNRVLLADRLRQAMAQARRHKKSLAVAYLDLDGFKEINDSHGHVVGDQVLSTLASRMRFALRESDTLARLGGDEFVALLVDLPESEDRLSVLTRLIETAAKPVRVGTHMLRVSASVGVVYYPDSDEVDADQLLRQADQAMYQAKLAGKNRYHIFSAVQDSSVRSRYESLERVREALANCQLVLHYQPKVNMRTGKIIGAEALLRLQHPEAGLLSPAMFMPATENDPLSVEIGEWGIENALRQMETWKASGLDLPVSVNISGFHLQRPDFAERLSALLAAHPLIAPSSLELEVLESSALLDIMQASKALEACHQMGVSIALDDFGTGYSSLTYLKQLPAHVLKIDRLFVSGMLEESEDLSIVEGVLSLARAFRRQVIAEGVESVEHGAMLLKLGCELGQGYGICRPIPACEVPAWVASWRRDTRWAHVRPLHDGRRSLLHATVEHRALLAGLEAYLNGKRQTRPAADIMNCRLTEWLGSMIHSGYGALPAVRGIAATHQKFHTAFHEILDRYGNDNTPECAEKMAALHILHDQLQRQLEIVSLMRNRHFRSASRRKLNEKNRDNGKSASLLHVAKKSDEYQSGNSRSVKTYPVSEG
jgi:diguanylate cyclase (GGDEF)-like protein/PAS domain S-box-containing protein